LRVCPCLATFALDAMSLASASWVLYVLAMLQTPVSTRGDDTHDEVAAGDQSAQLSLRGSSRNQSVATPLGQACKHLDGVCDCVNKKYDDKCRSCMCGQGSTHWCDTACDPTGDDRENSCCQSFKQIGETCSQNWECGPMEGDTLCNPHGGSDVKVCWPAPTPAPASGKNWP
jgi:hypothetical protein